MSRESQRPPQLSPVSPTSQTVSKLSSRQPTEYAYVDGRLVPRIMTRYQVKVLFPQGAPALRSQRSDEPLFVNCDGGFELERDAQYTTITRSKSDPRASDGMEPPPSPQPRNAALAVSSGSSDGHGFGLLSTCKTIFDRVHDSIALPKFIVDLIDTSEFQRLRNLKQLGNTHFLYPGATHTRFEHSIGVAHLAMTMARGLQLSQPGLGITDRDVLCVMAAGLLHDIGHGPFSHLFEDVIRRAFRAQGKERKWRHEQMSTCLVRRIMTRADLSHYGLSDEDVNFIVLCIEGLRPDQPWPRGVGRASDKRFLVDIVANKRNGIDVDKLDYFLRDSMCCQGRASVDIQITRLLHCMRVINHEGQYQICFEEKMAQSLGDVFALRAKLHKHVYQHRVPRVIDLMITDALIAAEPYFKIRGADGVDRTLTESVDAPDAFVKLGDWILPAIETSSDDQLAPAQRILQRLNTRHLYQLAGQATFLVPSDDTSADLLHDQVLAYVPTQLREEVRSLVAVEFISISYGSSDDRGKPDDPISHVSFYNPKANPNQAFQLPPSRQSPLFSPSDFAEKTMLVVVREDEIRDIVMEAFTQWKARHRKLLVTPIPIFNSPTAGARRRRSGLSVEQPTPRGHRPEGLEAVEDPCL